MADEFDSVQVAENPSVPQAETISLTQAWGMYFIAFACLVGVALLAQALDLPFLIVPAYLGSGWYLNRKALPRLVVWHHMHNTVDRVAQGKLQMLVWWPLSYPNLLVRLAVVKFL